MFSFFRKDKSEDLLAFLKESQAELGRGPAYTQAKPPTQDSNFGIEVLEAQGGLAPELEEAAVLYANGKIGETAALLNRYLLDHPDGRDPLPWYMLFDLYELSDQAAPFEDAAVDFAVKFERSPPTWTPRNRPKTPSQPAPLMAYGENTAPWNGSSKPVSSRMPNRPPMSGSTFPKHNRPTRKPRAPFWPTSCV